MEVVSKAFHCALFKLTPLTCVFIFPQKVHTVMPNEFEKYATLEMDKEGKEGTMVGKLRVSTILERPSNIRKCG